MALKNMTHGFRYYVLLGFIAGFLGTLIFHQLTLVVLWLLHVAPFPPYVMTPTRPFGVPTVISLSFWGGIWGILFAWVHGRFPRGSAYWPTVFLFGAILPSLVALLVVLPIKGMALGGGWHFPLMITAFLVNGAWGIGTGIILKILSASSNHNRTDI